MKDELAEQLLNELVETRKSFSNATNSFSTAVNQIKWNRRNTVIQYALIAVVIIMICLGVAYYLDDRHAACQRGNDLRLSIMISLDHNAASIGAALGVVTGASPEKVNEYMDAYYRQPKPPGLELRDC